MRRELWWTTKVEGDKYGFSKTKSSGAVYVVED
jgi:hypothetical protein